MITDKVLVEFLEVLAWMRNLVEKEQAHRGQLTQKRVRGLANSLDFTVRFRERKGSSHIELKHRNGDRYEFPSFDLAGEFLDVLESGKAAQ